MLTMPCTQISKQQWWHTVEPTLLVGVGGKSRVDKQSVSSPRYSGQPMAISHQQMAAPEFEPSFADSKTQQPHGAGGGRAAVY